LGWNGGPRVPSIGRRTQEALMRVQVAGRHTDVGEALRTRITEELSGQIHKFFNRASDATVTVEKNGLGFDVDCALHLDSGITLQSQGHGGDAHAAFSDALGKLEKRVRRYKRRLRNHHADNKSPLPAETASAYVLAPLAEEEDAPPGGEAAEADAGQAAETAPLVIAETKVQVRTMSVSTAVMQLDLTDAPALLFRNAAHGGLGMVYRRADGNIGWVDPERPR
jgi:ribosomal subunit interface protein